MLQIAHNHFVIPDDHSGFAIAMCYNIIDECTRIGSGQNNTHLSDDSVENIGASLRQLISEDR